LSFLDLANIVTATFIWHPRTKALGTSAPVVNAATLQGQDPWVVNERYNVPNRERTRKATQETLDKPWASYCTTEGHESLIRAINYYYDGAVQRHGATGIRTARLPGALRSRLGPHPMTIASSA